MAEGGGGGFCVLRTGRKEGGGGGLLAFAWSGGKKQGFGAVPPVCLLPVFGPNAASSISTRGTAQCLPVLIIISTREILFFAGRRGFFFFFDCNNITMR